MRRNKLVTIMMASVLLLSGCGPSVVAPAGITITGAGNVATVEVEKTLQLTAVVHPEGADQTVTWNSSNAALATVSATGLVTGLAAGSVFINATSTVDTAITKAFALTITAKPVVVITPSSVTVSSYEDATSLEVDAKLQLSAVVGPAGASQQVVWSSADEAIATVNPDGNVTGKGVGSVAITATAKDVPSVKGSITLEVKEATPPEPTIDWAAQPFATHEQYMSAANGDTLKIKGKISHLSPVADGKVNYYIQNGASGFYVYSQNATLFPVEAGKVYEVGGFKGNYQGGRQIVDVEYFKEISEVINFTVSDISALDVMDNAAMLPYHSSWVSIDVGLITKLPTFGTSAYSVAVKVGEKTIDYRVDPVDMTNAEFLAITAKFQGAAVGAAISVKGIMSAFGYGTPKNQIRLMKAEDVVPAPLTPEQVVENAAIGLTLPNSVAADVTTIALPTTLAAFDGVTVEWASDNAAITAAGVVTHTAANVDVKLTATLTFETAVETKEFTVTVFSVNDSLLSVVHVYDLEDALPGSPDTYGNSPTKSSYDDKKGNIITLGTPEAAWLLSNCLIGGDGNEKKVGNYAIRMQSNAVQEKSGRLELRTDFEFNMLEFKTAVYGANTLGMVLVIEYSVDSGATWVTMERTFEINTYTLETIRVLLPTVGTTSRVAISARAGTGQRVNIDDIRLIQQGV